MTGYDGIENYKTQTYYITYSMTVAWVCAELKKAQWDISIKFTAINGNTHPTTATRFVVYIIKVLGRISTVLYSSNAGGHYRSTAVLIRCQIHQIFVY